MSSESMTFSYSSLSSNSLLLSGDGGLSFLSPSYLISLFLFWLSDDLWLDFDALFVRDRESASKLTLWIALLLFASSLVCICSGTRLSPSCSGMLGFFCSADSVTMLANYSSIASSLCSVFINYAAEPSSSRSKSSLSSWFLLAASAAPPSSIGEVFLPTTE